MARPDAAATLQELLLRAVDFPGDRAAAARPRRAGDLSLLAGDRRARGRGGAAGSPALGVEPGERVALVYPTGAEFFDAFFGILLAGAVPVPLYPPVRLGRLDEYRERTAGHARGGRRGRRARRPAAGAARSAPAVERARPRAGCLTARRAARRALAGRRRRGRRTSRSSSSPRAPPSSRSRSRSTSAPCSPRCARSTALWPDTPRARPFGRLLAAALPRHGADRLRLPGARAPLGADAAAARGLRRAPRALAARALAPLAPRISPAPNFAYALAAERMRDDELEGVDLSNWRCALCGAETVVADTLRRFTARFAPYGFRAEALTPVYGLSEAALAVTFPPLGRRAARRALRARAARRRGARRARPGGARAGLGRRAAPRLPARDARRATARRCRRAAGRPTLRRRPVADARATSGSPRRPRGCSTAAGSTPATSASSTTASSSSPGAPRTC